MGGREQGDLSAFVRERRVHYEVEPEQTAGAPGPELVGVRLRLLATHERGRLGAPGCEACRELLAELRAFAERVAAEAGVADRTEATPATRKLYQSAEDRNADEVAVTLRVLCTAPEHRCPGAAGEERCLAGLRDRLHALGVPRTG